MNEREYAEAVGQLEADLEEHVRTVRLIYNLKIAAMAGLASIHVDGWMDGDGGHDTPYMGDCSAEDCVQFMKAINDAAAWLEPNMEFYEHARLPEDEAPA
jgi:hypothetical protein